VRRGGVSQPEQVIGDSSHCRDNRHYSAALALCLEDSLCHVTNSFRCSNGSAAVFLNHQTHVRNILWSAQKIREAYVSIAGRAKSEHGQSACQSMQRATSHAGRTDLEVYVPAHQCPFTCSHNPYLAPSATAQLRAAHPLPSLQ
jgi:hypothetical protein